MIIHNARNFPMAKGQNSKKKRENNLLCDCALFKGISRREDLMNIAECVFLA